MAIASEDKPAEAQRRFTGFTFIELLATVVLIAAIMPVAMEGIALCTRLAGQSRRQIEAANLAKTKLTELVVTRDWESGVQGGDFGTDWPDYEWKAALTEWTDPTMRRLDLTVFWQGRGKQRAVTMSTLVYHTT
ncbi:MAG: hypothetical protein ACYTBJ_17475, partial [Planctomycetota bacterium]